MPVGHKFIEPRAHTRFPVRRYLIPKELNTTKLFTGSRLAAYLFNLSFAFGERQVNYTAENFLLSFSQPNFYFHATTAYDILRSKGLPLGKRDFVGRVRIKA